MALQTREEVARLLQSLADGLWSLAALRVLVERGVIEQLAAPCLPADLERGVGLPVGLARPVLDLLTAHGLLDRDGERWVAAPGLRPLLEGAGLAWLRADLRSTLLQSHLLGDAARRGVLELGWRFTDPDVLQAQGEPSAATFDMVDRVLLPQLGDLGERFRSSGAVMLDVGAGVAGIAIAMCRGYPALRTVCLEPAPEPLRLARENVLRSGLADRIELRAQRVEDLVDEAAFDFIWLPQMFLPDPVLAEALPRVRRALKPEGWLFTIAMGSDAETVPASASRLRNTLYGGGSRSTAQVLDAIGRAGLQGRTLSGSPGGSVTPIGASR